MPGLSIPVVLGTARKNRKSERVAKFICKHLQDKGDVSPQLVDVREHIYDATTPPWGDGGASESPTVWKDIIEQADALILVVPEYNHGYPGELKMLLDSLYNEYTGKPVGVCGVSSGGFGGTRVVEHITPVLLELGMKPVKQSMYVSHVKDVLDEDGHADDAAPLEDQLTNMHDALHEYVHCAQ